ncbi:MAG: hypothetical protein V1709_02955 [Planctomycetota bacterium]
MPEEIRGVAIFLLLLVLPVIAKVSQIFFKAYVSYKKNPDEHSPKKILCTSLYLIFSILVPILSIPVIWGYDIFLWSLFGILILFPMLMIFLNIKIFRKALSNTITIGISLWSILYFVVLGIALPGIDMGGNNIYTNCTIFQEAISQVTSEEYALMINEQINISWGELNVLLLSYERKYSTQLSSPKIKNSIINDHHNSDSPYFVLNGKIMCKMHSVIVK